MRWVYKSWIYKVASVCRYIVIKIVHRGKFQCPTLSMVGKNCGIYIFKNGKISCKDRVIIADDVMLYAKGKLDIGSRFGINQYSRIVAHEHIEIGDNVTIGQMVSILDHDHHFEMKAGNLELDGYTTAPVKIGNNIWIGDKCTILKGVTIGNNVVVGANTLVHKNVPPNVVIGGTPFKILKNLT